MRLRFPSIFAAVALLALTAGACGSDDDGGAGERAAPPEPVAQVDSLTGRTTAVTLDAGFVGLSLTAGGTQVELTDFVIDPGASVLTGGVSVDGEVAAEGAPLFFLDGRTLKPLQVNA
jgi:hypothetical protein